MLIGYVRVSKTDGSQRLDLQRDALTAAGVASEAIYEDCISGKRDVRPGLEACLKAVRSGDTLVVWKLDREVGLRVLTGQGAAIDTATASGRLVFGIFAALAEFERELIRERTRAGLGRGQGQRAEGWAQVCPDQSPGPARHGRDEESGYVGHRTRRGTRGQARDSVSIRRTQRRLAGARAASAGSVAGWSISSPLGVRGYHVPPLQVAHASTPSSWSAPHGIYGANLVDIFRSEVSLKGPRAPVRRHAKDSS